MEIISNVNVVQKDKIFNSDVFIKEGKIHNIKPHKKRDGNKIIDGKDYYLMPGMIDIHLHGSYNYDFTIDPYNSIETVSKGLVKEGTTSFIASLTVISHNKELNLLKQYSNIDSPKNGAHFLGVHSEGPYLNKKYKALMDETYLRNPSIKELDEMLEVSNNKLKIMTVAPELEGMDKFIPYAISKGVKIMIGHTSASYEETKKALDLKATGFTHLYNAMSQHQHREPGVVTCALSEKNKFSELIVDGFHVHPAVVKATYNCLSADNIILITDASLTKGMPDGDYIFSNLSCRKIGNTVRVIETGRIAGSSITMLDAIKNMKKYCNCSLNKLAIMSSTNPAKLLGIDDNKGSIEIGKDADLILVDKDLNLIKTFVLGKEVYSI